MNLTQAGWVLRTADLQTNYSAEDIAFGEGLFVVVGDISGANDFIQTSPDGINWTNRTAPMAGGIILQITIPPELPVLVA